MSKIILVVFALFFVYCISEKVSVSLDGNGKSMKNDNNTISDDEFDKEFEKILQEEENERKNQKNKSTKANQKIPILPKETSKPLKTQPKPKIAKNVKSTPKTQKVVSQKKPPKKPIKVEKPKKPVKVVEPPKISNTKKTITIQAPKTTKKEIPQNQGPTHEEDIEKMSRDQILVKYKQLQQQMVMLQAKLAVQQEMLNAQVQNRASVGGSDHMPSEYGDGMTNEPFDEEEFSN